MNTLRAFGIACIAASPLSAQAIYQPPPAPVDTTGVANTAQQALAAAQAAQAAANAAVTSVNGQSGAVTIAIPSLTGYATTSSVNAAIAPLATMNALNTALAPYATTTGVTSAIAAATPLPCPIQPADSLTGSAGTGATCMPRVDSSRPTLVQATSAVTASDGTFSGAWPAAFATTPTGRVAAIEVVSPTSAPYKCDFIVGGVTATNYSGKCWQIVATTLPTTSVALLGLVISPFQNAAAGLTVRIVGRQ